MPYMPELPRPYDRVVNYNQSVFNIRGIHTAPAGLESTSLVLCYGLGILICIHSISHLLLLVCLFFISIEVTTTRNVGQCPT